MKMKYIKEILSPSTLSSKNTILSLLFLLSGITVFAQQPSVDIVGAPTIVNTTASYNVSIQFSQAVNNFIETDITVENGSTSNFVGNDGDLSYSVDITPDGNGDITINVAAGVAQAVSGGSDNTAASPAITIFDAESPTVEIQGAPAIVNTTAASDCRDSGRSCDSQYNGGLQCFYCLQ
jgi:hypothetical protein